MKWAAGICGWFIPPVRVFPLYMKTPEASEKPCHRSKKTITLSCGSGTSGTLFDKPDILQRGALQSSLCLLLPFHTRCSHTSPTAGVRISVPSLAERTSRYRTPPLQFIGSQPISVCNFKITALQGRGPWAQIGLPATTAGVRAAGLEISPCKGHLDSERRVTEGRAVQWDMLVCQSCAHSHKNRTLWLRQQNASARHRYEQKVRSWGLPASAHFIEWGCEGGGGIASRHVHTSDNSWPVPRQEECSLIWACAIELRPEPIQLGVQHGDASVF